MTNISDLYSAVLPHTPGPLFVNNIKIYYYYFRRGYFLHCSVRSLRMGLDFEELQKELRKVPHLRLIVPAAAAVVWFFGRIIRPGKQCTAELTQGETEEASHRKKRNSLMRSVRLAYTDFDSHYAVIKLANYSGIGRGDPDRTALQSSSRTPPPICFASAPSCYPLAGDFPRLHPNSLVSPYVQQKQYSEYFPQTVGRGRDPLGPLEAERWPAEQAP